MDDINFAELADHLIPTALAAGAATLRHFSKDGCASKLKADGSPVTIADEEAEALILSDLAQRFGSIPVVAEEAASGGHLPSACSRFFLVDPLDGTREFTSGSGQFTVNIGLVDAGVPRFGIVYAPALGELYVTVDDDKAMMTTIASPQTCSHVDLDERHVITTRDWSEAGLTIVGSQSHQNAQDQAFIDDLPLEVTDRRSIGSSLKFCLVARGEADVYTRFGPTMEWDTAAGEAVLRAAGGTVLRTDGAPFYYGKAETGYLNPGFIAYGSHGLLKRLAGTASNVVSTAAAGAGAGQ
ncbi:MAG: 3'(2'),5'-bisphosphate nucleotidase CysQ [Pseudomonadota bacterium]